jgi:polysaccharide deacetylase family protein (PEP-CTERM system associated)
MTKKATETSDPSGVIAGWHERPAKATILSDANALTIDVEDYFQVEAFFSVISRRSWDDFECRIEANVERLLALLRVAEATATFFTLGWIALRYPTIVRRIVESGHELASHGFDHQRADLQSRSAFFEDVSRTKAILEDLGGVAIKGYRAPSFSVTRTNLWVMDALSEAGYCYSSSTCPISHDNYGIPDAPRFSFYPLADRSFLEIPVSTLRLLGRNWPCGGGGWFRFLPYAASAVALSHVRFSEKTPCVFYLHPWELDPNQPRISAASWKSRSRHYLNLGKTEGRLRRLLNSFVWRRIDQVFPLSGEAEHLV